MAHLQTPPSTSRRSWATQAERHGASVVARRLMSSSGVDATPTHEDNQGTSPHYCPICMLHYPTILLTKCCSQNVCGSCAMDLVTRAAGQPVGARMLRAPSLVAAQRNPKPMSRGETLAMILSQTPAPKQPPPPPSAPQSSSGEVLPFPPLPPPSSSLSSTSSRPLHSTTNEPLPPQAGGAPSASSTSSSTSSRMVPLPPVATAAAAGATTTNGAQLRSMFATASPNGPVIPCPYCSRTMKVRFVTATESSKSYRDSPGRRPSSSSTEVPTVAVTDSMTPRPPPSLLSGAAARAVRSAGLRVGSSPRRLDLTTPLRPTTSSQPKSPNAVVEPPPSSTTVAGAGVYAPLLDLSHTHDGQAGPHSSLLLLSQQRRHRRTTEEDNPSNEPRTPIASSLPPATNDGSGVCEGAVAVAEPASSRPSGLPDPPPILPPPPPRPPSEPKPTLSAVAGSTFQELRRNLVLWNGSSAYSQLPPRPHHHHQYPPPARHLPRDDDYDKMMQGAAQQQQQGHTGGEKLPLLVAAGGANRQARRHRREQQNLSQRSAGSATTGKDEGSSSSWCPIM